MPALDASPPPWHLRRHRCLHITLRDIDCERLDVARMIGQFSRWRITLFSFFAGGYVTTYPSRLPWQEVSPYLAPGRDLCGEILVAAREAGIIAFPMIDLGEIGERIARAHPEWCAQHRDGSPILKTDGVVTSCPLGAYRRELCRDLVLELRDRYGDLLGGIKWGGASYGFPGAVDHNPIMVERYRRDTGQALPEDRRDPVYARWQESVLAENVRHLRQVVREVAALPVVGNSVWHLGHGQDLEDVVEGQDFTQVEIQTRTAAGDDDADVAWSRFDYPVETTRYVAQVATRPPWVVASTFLAWPWRRVSVPFAEQKLYVAQVIANGGSPMFNLTSGAPDQHDDPRCFDAIADLMTFQAAHEHLMEGDRSAARIALVYDQASAVAARDGGNAARRYLDEFVTWEETLETAHLPFDIISTRLLLAGRCRDDYRVLLIPSAIAASEALLGALAGWSAKGVGLVFSGGVATASSAAAGHAFAALTGVRFDGRRLPFHDLPHPGPCQAYARWAEHHPVREGIPIALLAVAGHYFPAEVAAGMATPLRRARPFRLFPEGLARTLEPDPAEPLLAARSADATGGPVVVFCFDSARAARRTGHPDNQRMLANAIRWAAEGEVGLEFPGFPDVRASLRTVGRDRVVHLINTTGRQRYLTEFTPVHDLRFIVSGVPPARVIRASDGLDLEWRTCSRGTEIQLPRLLDYDLVHLVAR